MLPYVKYAFVLSITLLNSLVFGQKNNEILTLQTYMEWVQKNHPIVKQADLMVLKAKANLTSVRGAFDPEAYSSINQKEFSNKNYFQLFEAGVSYKTPYALQFKGAYTDAQGDYVNPQNTAPDKGLYSIGAYLPLGSGLLMDEQRLALKQAKIFKQSSETERLILINQTLFKALVAYFEWMQSGNLLTIAQEANELAKQRLILTKTSYLQGDKPAIDTLEAYILVQTRAQNLIQAKTDYLNAQLHLSNFLWDDGQNPVQNVNSYDYPKYESFELSSQTMADSLFSRNRLEYERQPELIVYQYKKDALRAEKRLKQEKIKPKINVNYNFLSSQWNQYDWAGFTEQNYKWGASMSLPLFLRNGRGEVKMANFKLKEIQYEILNKQQVVKNKLQIYSNEHENLKQQLSQQKELIKNTRKLLEAERMNYISGESSVFMINTREANYLKAQEKLVEYMAKYEKNISSFKAYMGLLP